MHSKMENHPLEMELYILLKDMMRTFFMAQLILSDNFRFACYIF